jgi:polar amino acid transport system substrate-binding protein
MNAGSQPAGARTLLQARLTDEKTPRRGRARATLLGLLAALTMVAAACGGGTQANDTQDRGVLRAVSDPNYAPQSFYDARLGRWRGFDVDVATEIADRLGVEVRFQTGAFEDVAAGNWQDDWDISVGSVTVTPARAEKLSFTPAYYYATAAVAVNKDNTSIRNPEADLDSKRIGVCDGCTYESYLRGTLQLPSQGQIPSAIKNPLVVTYGTDAEAIDDLARGDGVRLDAVISALPTLEEAIDHGAPIKVVGAPLYTEELAVAILKDAPLDSTSLVQRVSQIVQAMHADGTLTSLSNKWYGTDLTTAKAAANR